MRDTTAGRADDRWHFGDPYDSDSELLIAALDRTCSAEILAKVFWRKVARRLLRRRQAIQPVVVFNTPAMFDAPSLYGGGLTLAEGFCHFLLELGLKRCSRLLDFCAGPGYIGYSLLVHGFCEELVLSDVNPAAVELARYTAKYNRIEHLVDIYLSEGLSEIPKDERWDLVVSNPPALLPRDGLDSDIITFDPGWALHRHFYSSVKPFMNEGGHVIMLEMRAGSSVEVFEPMIQDGGGRLVEARIAKNLAGDETDRYYVVSKW